MESLDSDPTGVCLFATLFIYFVVFSRSFLPFSQAELAFKNSWWDVSFVFA